MTASRSNPISWNNHLQQMQRYYATVRGRARRMYYGARRRAIEKNLTFEITIEDIERALTIGRCERTGIPFEIGIGSSVFAPSIDRIKNNIGYTKANVQYVCCAYNTGKKHMTDIDFESFILMAAQFIKLKYGGR